MTIDEIINLINYKELNRKTNNYIFKDLNKNEINKIITSTNKESIIENIDNARNEEISFDVNNLINIIIDLNDVNYYDILNFALNALEIDEKINLETLRDLLKFKGILRKNKKAVQFLINNVNLLSKNDTKIFNQIMLLNTYFYNTIIFNDLNTYETINKKILDGRENYTKVNILRLNVN